MYLGLVEVEGEKKDRSQTPIKGGSNHANGA